MNIPKLDIGWWAVIAVCLILEVAAVCTLDYQLDTWGVIIGIHLFPAIVIASVFVWGPSKEK